MVVCDARVHLCARQEASAARVADVSVCKQHGYHQQHERPLGSQALSSHSQTPIIYQGCTSVLTLRTLGASNCWRRKGRRAAQGRCGEPDHRLRGAPG